MKNNKLTYRMLSEKLKEFGYTRRDFEFDNKRLWAFEHSEFETATILMPRRPLDEPVHPSHIGSVRAKLKAHGLMDENSLSVI